MNSACRRRGEKIIRMRTEPYQARIALDFDVPVRHQAQGEKSLTLASLLAEQLRELGVTFYGVDMEWD